VKFSKILPKETFIFIYVTSQKSGFQFPRATSRQSHEGPRVYITTFWRNKYIRWLEPAILKNPSRVQRLPRVLRVALLIPRVDKISATQT
jgi:hypothetical protein